MMPQNETAKREALLDYDKAADVLYVTFGQPKHVVCVDGEEDTLVWLDAESQGVVGFTLLNFIERLQMEADRAMAAFAAGERVQLRLMDLAARQMVEKRDKVMTNAENDAS